MRVIILAAIAAIALTGCNFKMPGDTTAAPTAGKEYYVNKDGEACTVDPVKGTVVIAGPYATRDNAKAAKDSNEACKKTMTPAPAA